MDYILFGVLCLAFFVALKIYLNLSEIILERIIEQWANIARFSSKRSVPGILSIIVPFYNEEQRLKECAQGIERGLEGYTGHHEVIFVDDDSCDASLAIIQGWADLYRGPATIKIASSGRSQVNLQCRNWVGKSLPCHVGYRHSRGEYLLFLDADVQLEPDAIGKMMACFVKENSSFLSVIPKLRCGSVYSWAFYPLTLVCQILAFDFIRKNPEKSQPSASGQIMLFKRDAYEKIGGFAALSDNVAQDVRAAKLMKANCLDQQHILGFDLACIVCEAKFMSMVRSFSKSILVAVEHDVAKILLFPLIMILMTGLPYLALGYTWSVGTFSHRATGITPTSLSIGVALMTILVHILTLVHFRVMLMSCRRWLLLYPLGALILMFVACHSLFTYYSGNRKLWKWKDRQIVAESQADMDVRISQS